MSHDTHHHTAQENQTIISFKSSFWLVIIIVGLFIAALNFIKAEGGETAKEARTEEKQNMDRREAGQPAEQGAPVVPNTQKGSESLLDTAEHAK